MEIINVHDAKTHLSRLIDKAVRGEPFIIAKAGKPMVKVTAVEPTDGCKPRVGFLAGQLKVPSDFDEMGRKDIEGLFEG